MDTAGSGRLSVLNSQLYPGKARPVRVLQYGEGNFLRGFADHMIDIANEKGVFDGNIVIVKPRKGGSLQSFKNQDCRYTVRLKGVKSGRFVTETRVVSSVSGVVHSYDDFTAYMEYASEPELRFVLSNTTEAGIVYKEEPLPPDSPPDTFPGKLTQFLYARYLTFDGDDSKGLIILPAELIENNGSVLKDCILTYAGHWSLPRAFVRWLDGTCVFASTSVDRIITGFPKDGGEPQWKELGYEDRLLVEGESYGSWIIESDRPVAAELPLDMAGLPVIFTGDLESHKQIKVRILNGAHTAMVPVSFLAGNGTVAQSMEDPLIRDFLTGIIYSEILPALPESGIDSSRFAGAVIDRFRNPGICHSLLDISLNSVSKWRARCLPSLLDYFDKKKSLPCRLVFSIAALIAFYSSSKEGEGCLVGNRNSEAYLIKDDPAVLDFFCGRSIMDGAVVSEYLANGGFHGSDLNLIPGLASAVEAYLGDIRDSGMRGALRRLMNDGTGDAE